MSEKIKGLKRVEIDPAKDCNGMIEYNDTLTPFYNVLEFNELRLQIKRQALEGCVVIWFNSQGEEVRIPLTVHGKLTKWPKGFGDTYNTQMYKML